MTFTAKELESAIEAERDNPESDLQDLWWEVEWLLKQPRAFTVNGEEVYVVLASYDSGLDPDYDENYKTNIEIILKADGRLFRKTGYHQSFTGGDFSGPFEEVKPVEKTITVYESA